MRKLKYVLAMFVMTGLMLTSCSSNDDYNEDNNEDPSGGETTGDYWPTAVGNQWTFDQNGSESNMKIIGTEKINNDTYFKFDQLAGTGGDVSAIGDASIKKVNGDYYIKFDEIVFEQGEYSGKSTGYEYILFKDYLEVGKTWSGSYNQETTFNIPDFPAIKITVNYKGTILERGATATIKNVTYKDVIKFNFHLESRVADQVTSNDVVYWIAKDFGIIKMSTGNYVTELVSFTKK